MMSLADAARQLGYPVFPCDGNKRPVVETGFKAATLDPARIAEMFSRAEASMIGVPTGRESGLVAIDVDIRSDRSGMAWLNENREALPETRTHRTKSGGLHLIFQQPEGYEIRNSAGRIAPGIDVRGDGGYIIVPPSPGYAVADATDPAEMPMWLIRACCRPEPERNPTPILPPRRITEGGTPYALVGLDRECRAIAFAPDGQKHDILNRAAYSIGGLVSAGELDEGTARSALRAALSAIRDRCEDFRAAERTLEEAFTSGVAKPRRPSEPRYTNGTPGYTNGTPETEQHQRDTPQAGRSSGHQSERPAGALELVYYQDILPRLDTLDFVEGLLLENSAAVVYGESNSGKTFWTTDLALHIAAGAIWRDREVTQGGVVYAALEGSAGFSNRIVAWREQHCDQTIPFAAIKSSLNLLNPDADTGRLIEAIKEAAKTFEMPVKLVIIDTLSRAMAGGNENASEDMGALVMNTDRIRAETGACVLFVHHSGKDAAKGARGHSILRAAIETEIEVSSEEGSDVRVARAAKQREMPTIGIFEFKLQIVDLGMNQRGKPVTTCLVEHVEGDAVPRAKLPGGHAQTAYRLLTDVCAASGEKHHASFDQPSVPEDWWRERFYDRAMPGANLDTKKHAFRRAADALQRAGKIGLNRGRVWVAKP